MSFKVPNHIFREYDIRGIADKDITTQFAELLGLAYAKFISKNSSDPLTISVGRDCRLTSDRYAESLISGLRKAGLNVISLGTCPTPLTYFSIFHLKTDGGIMITGSHNPANYNGFKICVGKDTLHGSQIQDLKNLVLDANENPSAYYANNGREMGSYKEYPIIPDYVDFVVKNAKKTRPMKIVIDSGNGTASTVAPEVFSRLGAEVIPLYCELDGRFPNHHPDPTVVDNLKVLIETVKREKADFGVAFDGDSDRIGLVDESGKVIYGDEMMVLFSRDVLKTNPGATIISEVKSSYRLYDDIAAKGGKPVMWKTGHSLIKSKMKETKAVLAGEMSGHIFFADRYFGYDDAIYAAVRVFEIASEITAPLSSLISDLAQTITTPEIRLDCEESKKFDLVQKTKEKLSALYKTNDIDGVRVDFEGGWGLVRASNTQPVLVLRFEALNFSKMKEIRAIVEDALHLSAKEVGHPPIDVNATSAGH